MKNAKRLTSFFLFMMLLFSTLNCANSKDVEIFQFSRIPPFTVSEIVAQDWATGLKHKGAVTKVHVTFDVLEENIKIVRIYFDNKTLLVSKLVAKQKEFIATYKAFHARDIIMDINPKKEAKNSPIKISPFKLGPNEAVIEDAVDGVAAFFKVSNVVIKPMAVHAASNRD